MGFLQAHITQTVREGKAEKRRAEKKSRGEKMGEAAAAASLPKLGFEQEQVLLCFLEVGPTLLDGSGEAPLNWSEVRSYVELQEPMVPAWAYSMLVKMSREFLQGRSHGEDPLAMPPVDMKPELEHLDD